MVQILHFIAVILLISIGQNLIILAGGGGIDLSVGSIISLSGVVLALLCKQGLPIGYAIILVLLLSLLLGGLNGFAVVNIKMPPLIATLGTLYMYGGLALVLAKTGTVSGFPEGFSWLGQENIFGIPAKILCIVAPILVLVIIIMKRTEIGRNIVLIGVNETAARFAGIEVPKIRFGLYIFSAFLAAIGGILMASYLMVAKADIGRDMELQAITIVMLAGTSIKGGVGKVENIIFAALIITMLSTGLQLAQINAVWQMGVLGTILLLTIMLNNMLEKIK
ncbi:MAG: ABC transporter permease [Brevinema sp.]